MPRSDVSNELLEHLRAISYSGEGQVTALVETPSPGTHVTRSSVRVTVGKGFQGDHESKSFFRGKLIPGRDVTAMNMEVLQVLSVDPATPGDNLFVQGLDLASLEPGDRLSIGQDVVLERSDREHRPCVTFRDRTSQDVFTAVSQDRFRGTLFTVIEGGIIRLGDAVRILTLSAAAKWNQAGAS